MDLGDWDDDDFELTAPRNNNINDEDVDDLIQFTDSLTFQAEQENGDANGTTSNPVTGTSTTDGQASQLSPLPSDTIDLTRNRGVLLKRLTESTPSSSTVVTRKTTESTETSSPSSSTREKPSAEKPFVELHFDGYLVATGDRFDSSRDLNYPMIVRLDLPPTGRSTVIPGLELGLHELCAGEKATLTIKSRYAYGEKGSNDIPPNSDLLFELEVLDVRATRKAVDAPVDNTKSDLSRLEDIRRQREIAQQRREEEALARDAEKKRKADRAAQLREKIANNAKGSKPKKGKKKK